MSIVIGVPPKRVQSQNKEKYPGLPVVKMEKVEGKGFNRRFLLNQLAVDTLGIIPGQDSVILAFDEENKKAFIGRYSSEDSVIVGKNLAFSNKRFYEYTADLKNLDTSDDVYLELDNPTNVGEIEFYELIQLQEKLVENTNNEVLEQSEEKEPDLIDSGDVYMTEDIITVGDLEEENEVINNTNF